MNQVPQHIAIIMDGNGRWAQQRGLSRSGGHKAGVKAAKNIIRLCIEHGVQVLTLFAFSTENWVRPKHEVAFLMQIFMQLVSSKEARELMQHNIKLRVIGELTELDTKLYRELIKLQDKTSNNTGLQLNVAINYSGRWDLLQAVRKVASSTITEHQLQEQLCVADPDLLIRTSGEMRISNFMLWQLAYTELYFTDVLWPDFGAPQFLKALATYAKRQRRFGGV